MFANEIGAKKHIDVMNHWFIENGILNDHVMNNLVLFIMSSSRWIKDLKIFVDRDRQSVGVLIYLSRWGMLFFSKGIYNDLHEALSEYLFKYNVDIAFDLYGKGGKNGRKEKRDPDKKAALESEHDV